MSELPLVLTVEEAAAALRIGRTAAYEAIRRGDLPAVRIGGRSLRVPRHRLEAFINGGGPAGNGAAAKTGEGTPDGSG